MLCICCPNRMDPPTTYASSDNYISPLNKGRQTVLQGGGGSGGAVILTREKPLFNEQGSPIVSFPLRTRFVWHHQIVRV
jgi:hypothetical protein